MAVSSSGAKPGPPRRPRKQTQTTKSHRYEPFTKRVAKVKIDPIHRVQRSRLKESSDDISQSFFRAALDEWSELNLTNTFTAFLNKVAPLSENLPQLLHHADTIAQSLVEALEKQDPLASEALLSLVAHLAHDLGQDFEKYFKQIVSTVAKVSVSQSDPAVIEACFTCLAWIFKYLSRLLVQDLRPLLDILLPYFSARQDYVRHFTSESLAFLFRKAAVQYSKNETPLRIAVKHLLQATPRTIKAQDEAAYLESCLLLLAESAVGVDAGLHSSASDLYRCVYNVFTSSGIEYPSEARVPESLLIALIHRTDSTGFQSMLDTILSLITDCPEDSQHYSLTTRLLMVVIVTRSGSRINDWDPVLTTTLTALHKTSVKTLVNNLTKAAVGILQFCPLDQLLPLVPQLMDAVMKQTEPRQFFSFCDSVARLGKHRFQDLILPYLQKYIIAHWAEDPAAIVVTLSDLHDNGCTDRQVGKPGYLAITEPLESSTIALLDESTLNEVSASEQCRFLSLARSIHFPKYPGTAKSLMASLQNRVLRAAAMKNRPMDLSLRLTLGWEFQTLVQLSTDKSAIEDDHYLVLLDQPSDRFQLLPFVEALTEISTSFEKTLARQSTVDRVSDVLVKNMINGSAELRKVSILLLQSLYAQQSLSWLDQSCELILEILRTTYSISNARQLGMLIRRIPTVQRLTPVNHSLSALLPLFSMGLIPQYHDYLRKDLASVLGQMVAAGDLEDQIVDILRDWLQAPVTPHSSNSSADNEYSAKVSSFECTKLNEVDTVFDSCIDRLQNAKNVMETQITTIHALHSSRIPINSRLIALQILLEIPQLAERRSKILVPAFLAAQRGRTGRDLSHLEESHSVNTLSPDIEECGWTLKERKVFLQLLGLFNNPRVLYRTDDVRAVLLDLLSNGDAETRKLSLIALLKWKDSALVSRRDDLLSITEDNKTTSEIASLLDVKEEAQASQDFQRSEILPVVLRLVFGLLVGRAGVPGSQEAKRKSLLRVIFRMSERDIILFLDIVKGRLRNVNVSRARCADEFLHASDPLSDDQHYGFLRMCLSILEILQTQFRPFGSQILDAVLYCTTMASHQIHALNDAETAPSLTRNIRRAGVQCLNLIFEHCPQLDLNAYTPLLFSELIKPRIPKFVAENAQGVSGLLKMFSIWAANEQYCSLLSHEDAEIARSCWHLLGSNTTKPEVKVFILLDIIGSLLDLQDDHTIQSEHSAIVLKDGMTDILSGVSALLEQNLTKELLFAATKVLQRLAGSDGTPEIKKQIIQVLAQLLEEPSQRLPPHVKAQILKAIEKIAEASDVQLLELTGEGFFDLLSSYFNFFRDIPNRETCCRILGLMTIENPHLVSSKEICDDLTATSRTSLDGLDHARQDVAFSRIHESLQSNQPSKNFLPVLHNLIYLTRTSDETAVRGNALGCLKHFVKEIADGDENVALLQKVLLQAVRKQLTNDSEAVRADFVELLGGIVRNWQSEVPLQDMHSLLVGDDDEASFFTNILHIQHHRRNRAMRRLTSQVEAGLISAENIAEFFLPLLQKFANDDSNNESALSTKGQSVASITILLQWLEWKTFRKVFRQYKQSLDQKRSEDKLDVRLLSHAADALTTALAAKVTSDQGEGLLPHLAKSLPSQDVIASELKSNFISKLTELAHYKDEGEIDQRIPAAVVAIKLIKLLPAEELSLLASPVVLDVAQVLRSRTQETRDLARNKLAEIVNLLGPTSVHFVLKELGTALTRGYQLHVLGYTMHTILLTTADTTKVGDFDYCIQDIMKVILDDIFGVVGQEKENQDYISSMKEVKRNKSFDSIELLAKCASVQHLSKLVLPFESLLAGSLTPKQVRNVDELFRRIGVGISHSPAASSQELLIFAFELITSFYRVKPTPPGRPQTNDEKNRERFLIQKDNASNAGKVTTSSMLYKIAKFAIDIARSTFSRHSELMTPENVHGFVPIIGDALIEGQEDVKVSALRLLSAVIKVRLPEFEENAKLYVLEAVKMVRSAVNTNEESAQAALKLVATILREKRDVDVRESDVAYLLKRTLPDLEDPDRQGVTFNLAKAVMARKMQMPEVYELVDQIGLMMVTSQSKSSRDAARGVYVHFLLDYPQGKNRWAKQIKFLVKNLEYQHPEGRQSVIEAIGNLLAKLDSANAQETAAIVFIPLVLRMSGDENLQCREMAAALLSILFRRIPADQIDTMLEPVRGWLVQDEKIALKKLSLQTWSIFFNSVDERTESMSIFVRSNVVKVLKGSENDQGNWEVQYQAMELLAVLVAKHPALILTNKQRQLWNSIMQNLTSRESWLQHSAAKLMALFFADCATIGEMNVPLVTSHGLKLDEEQIIQLVRSFVGILKRQTTSKELAQTVIQSVVFLGRLVMAREIHMPLKAHAEDIDTDEDDTVKQDQDVDDSDEEADSNDDTPTPSVNGTKSIPVIQYILDQATHTLRREPPKQLSAALQPKLSFIALLSPLLRIPPTTTTTTTTPPPTSLNNLTQTLTALLIPLLHLTSPTLTTPRSSDPLFAPLHATLIESCTLLLNTLQQSLGDQRYMTLVTAATKVAREKRLERRRKRDLEVVADPERAARGKRRKVERKKERRGEVKGLYRAGRRRDLGF